MSESSFAFGVVYYFLLMKQQHNIIISTAFCNLLRVPQPPIGSINIRFISGDGTQAVSAATCGRSLVLSTNITDQNLFVCVMHIIIPDTSFTMPQ